MNVEPPAPSLERHSQPSGLVRSPASPLLTVDNLRVLFAGRKRVRSARSPQAVRAVDGVSFEVAQGETLALVGESGCGKSTTALAVLRLIKPTSGRVMFDGVDIERLKRRDLQGFRRRVQVVFQDPFASLNPRWTVEQIITEPLHIHRVGSRHDRHERAADLLEKVGLDRHLMTRYPHEFSGGQRQRISIARALALRPDLVVADEPVSSLDVSIQAQILNLMADLQEEFNLTYILIAHNLAVVRQTTDRVAVMYLGKIVEVGPTDALFENPGHPYTVALLSAMPRPDPAIEPGRERLVLRGSVPSPANPPSGCRFHTRCWLRQKLGNPDICASDEPSLQTVPSLSAHQGVACHFASDVIGSEEQRVSVA